MKTTPNRRFTKGECCVRSPDGTVSDRSLHEQVLEGVDDSDFRVRSGRRMLELGVPREVVDRLYLDLPPESRRTTE
jgi:hypothetical protein